MDDPAKVIVARLERQVFDTYLSLGRLDVLDAIRDYGYEMREEPDGSIAMVVLGHVIATIGFGLGTVTISPGPPGTIRPN